MSHHQPGATWTTQEGTPVAAAAVVAHVVVPAGHLAQRIFFPAAALFAALGPWLLLGLPVHGEPFFAVSTHANSMLVGYVGALIAGYLGGRVPTVQLVVLFGLWLAGRLAELTTAEPLFVQALYAGFGLNLAVLVVPRFSAAKKWRNRLIVPLLAAITCFPLLLLAGGALEVETDSSLHSLVLMIALLMFFMGGRFITPQLARACADRGVKLPHRVQPVLEGTVMLLLLCAITLSLGGAGESWTALPVGLSGLLVLVRLARWRLLIAGPGYIDLKALGIGYFWLGFGLLAFSLSFLGVLPVAASLHVVTVGALGTLSSTVMLKTTQATRDARAVVYYPVIALLTIACIARLAAGSVPDLRATLLMVAAVSWSLNFMLVFFHLVCVNRTKHARGRDLSRQVRTGRYKNG